LSLKTADWGTAGSGFGTFVPLSARVVQLAEWAYRSVVVPVDPLIKFKTSSSISSSTVPVEEGPWQLGIVSYT